MFESLKNHAYSKANILQLIARRSFIGIDMGDDAIKMIQLSHGEDGISLVAGGSRNRPVNMEPGSGDWQRWAVEAISDLTANNGFKGRDIIATMPASEILIEHVKISKSDGDKSQDMLSKVKQKLSLESDSAVIRYIPTEEDNCLVMLTEREKIDRHLAIYEKANLQIKAMGSWPVALMNTYTTFFGRRSIDLEAVVMLVDIGENRTSIVVCRHKKLLFARSIPIGASQLGTDEMANQLISELSDSRRQLASTYRKVQIQRLIFLSPRIVDRNVCETIAQRMSIPAQMGDCLGAVEISVDWNGSGVDRRDSNINWATAFGLSLS